MCFAHVFCQGYYTCMDRGLTTDILLYQKRDHIILLQDTITSAMTSIRNLIESYTALILQLYEDTELSATAMASQELCVITLEVQ